MRPRDIWAEQARQEKGIKEFLKEPVDLRKVTRNSRHTVSTVDVLLEQGNASWLVFGEADIICHNRGSVREAWTLKARLPENVTDIEHDSAYALQLEMLHVRFEFLDHGRAYLWGTISPHNLDGFRVPRADYNPMKLAEKCDGKQHCRRGEPHLMLPDGYFVPPADPELYALLAGRKVQIVTGTNHDASV